MKRQRGGGRERLLALGLTDISLGIPYLPGRDFAGKFIDIGAAQF